MCMYYNISIINSIILLNLLNYNKYSIILYYISFVVCIVDDHTPNGEPE